MRKVQLIKIETVKEMTSISKATIYRKMADGSFPSSVSVTGSKAVAWHLQEVIDWIEQRPRTYPNS